MPIRPRPIIYQYTACRWSKTVAPRSDALMPGEYFKTCPACGHAPLTTQTASAAQAGFAQAAATIQSWLR